MGRETLVQPEKYFTKAVKRLLRVTVAYFMSVGFFFFVTDKTHVILSTIVEN